MKGEESHVVKNHANTKGTIKIRCYIFAALTGALTIGTFVSGMVGEEMGCCSVPHNQLASLYNPVRFNG